MFSVVSHRKIWYLISGILVLVSAISVGVWRFNFGIDFTGGSLIELEFSGARPLNAEVQKKAEELGAARVKIQTAGEKSMMVRSAPLNTETHKKIIDAFTGQAIETRYESIGPSIGAELTRKTIVAIILSLFAIIFYVAWAFRKVGREVSAWVYGLAAVVALFHDVLIPMGVFALLGKLMNVEVDASFIAAVLTILGYSVNDTIIIFDRIRENLILNRGRPFGDIVDMSLRQTYARSINTTLTTVLALLAVFFLGGASVRYFALALMIGIALGAYSSIFVAAPLLVSWYNKKATARPFIK